jgi:hypothetical protein
MPIGGSMAHALPMPIDIDLPGSPKRYYEYGPVRFKFMVDGKYEFFTVSAKGDRANLSSEIKLDPAKKTASLKAGLKGKLTPNIDAQAIGKISKDSITNLCEAFGNPKKFIYGLVRYLDVVIGHNFNVGSEYMSFAGVGFALDADMCFGSVLLPLRYPLKWEHDNMSVSGKIVADLIIKVGPSMEMWKAMAKKLGAPRVAAMARLLVQKANVELPKAAATAAVEAGAAAAGATTMGAFLETIGTWRGPVSLAIPISFALRDFCMYITNAARASGIHDGQMTVYAGTYVRTIYGLERMPSSGDVDGRVKMEAYSKAVDDINKHGLVGMQMFLEKQFKMGQRCADANGDNPDRFAVRVISERMWLQIRGR